MTRVVGKSSAIQPWIVQITLCLYRWVLCLGPEAFRREYEAEMMHTLRQYCQDEYARRGGPGVLRLWPTLFLRAIADMVAEQFSPPGGGAIMRRATILTYGAFVLFVIGYLTLMRVSDPAAPFNAVAQAHPQVGIAYHAISISIEVAVLAMLVGSGLVLYSIVTSARASGVNPIKLFIPTKRHMGMLIAGTLLSAFCLTLCIVGFGFIAVGPPHIAGQPLWMALLAVLIAVFLGSALCTFMILLLSLLIALAVARSDIGPRIFRLVRICMVGTLLGMGVSFVATLCWIALLWSSAPQFTASDAGLGMGNLTWVILALGAMLVALYLDIAACRQSLKVHPPLLPQR
ncbi:hypothetical protein KDH_75070 [Dictyobacter sp. S3.2.2.5]|uniref:ABC transporter permease n=1 Tax=Dictyobacter halimunensis TaxID=3026934 RepID=A0ABQ6G790_9CHLR|nr:hypothetical protein KDH_75070 [Dictyobacter sp. S3.2.2.5]